jgi:NAD(P)-dependent dehydrogenase (short-subunit alcohol dehydrogenase family)
MATLEGKVALVTAGGTGIGFACSKAIVESGGCVMITARREEMLQKAASELGPNADYVVGDVTRQDSMDAAVQATLDRFGGLHLNVNSAGMGGVGTVLNSTDEEFATVLDTTLNGTFRAMRSVAKAMKAGGGGSIVNISSIASTHTHRWMTAYCTAKAGVNMLTRCAADDLGEFGVRVNAVCPGLVDTEMVTLLTQNQEAVDEYLRRMPISRIGKPEDVGALVAFLLSDEAGWITGQCIGVDGGHNIRQGPDLVDPVYSKFFPVER